MDFSSNNTFFILAALILIIVIYILYNYAYAPYQYLRRIGIPGPKPLPFIGNYHQSKKYLKDMRVQLCSVYGETCGFYIGSTPYVVTTNIDMIKEYTVKKFDCFEDRSTNSGALHFPIKGETVPSLVTMRGEVWRSARHASTPAFSALKMKQMEPMIRESAQALVKTFGKFADTGKTLNMTEMYQKLLIEILMAAAFGREIHVQDGSADRLHEEVTSLMADITRTPGGQFDGLLGLGAAFPLATKIFNVFEGFTGVGKKKKYLVEVTEKMRDYRKKEKDSSRKDVLQVMIDAAEAKKMEDSHVIAIAVDVLMAGHETTTSSLSFSSFLLATNQDVQERLISEIAQYFEENPDKSHYEAAQEIEYLEMFLMETFRMFSPGSMIARVCTKSCELGGYHIKKGTYVVTPIYGVHYNRELWPEPEKFDPERFNKENRPKIPSCAHMPFGAGPRQCIGMRLAIMNAKIVLIEILRKYKFVLAPETKLPMRVHLSIPGSPKDTVYLRVESQT